MDLHSLLSAVQIAAILAFFLLLCHLLRSGRFLSVPFFTAYCALMVIDLIWHPLTIAQGVWIQPWILSLEFCTVIEAYALAADGVRAEQRRDMLLFLLSVGAAASAMSVGFYQAKDLAGYYRSISQQVRVGLAVLCIAGNLYHAFNLDIRWDRLWLPHLRIVSAFLIMRALMTFAHLPGSGYANHAVIRVAWLGMASAWVLVYLWYERRELRTARFKRSQPVF